MTGRYWALACGECLQGMHLGRLVEIDDQERPIEPHFGGYRRPPADEWISEDRLRGAIDGFLLQHVGHDLAVVDADRVGDFLAEYDQPGSFTWITDPTRLRGRPGTSTSAAGTLHLIGVLRARLQPEG